MWKLPENNRPNFGQLEPLEVLYEIGTLRIFTFVADDRLFFAYPSAESDDGEVVRLLVVPTGEHEVAELKIGHISLTDILSKDFVWAIDVPLGGSPLNVTLLPRGLADVPEPYKPVPGTMLWAHLQRKTEVRKLVASEINELSKALVARAGKFVASTTIFRTSYFAGSRYEHWQVDAEAPVGPPKQLHVLEQVESYQALSAPSQLH